MKELKTNHYIDTVIFACDVILHNLKAALRTKLDALELGITSEQFVVLDTISCSPNIHQQELSDMLMKDKSNITRIIKILEEKKLIKKDAGNKNNRLVYILNITDSGQKIIDKAIPIMKEYLTDIFTNISDKEVDNLHEISKRLQKDLYKTL